MPIVVDCPGCSAKLSAPESAVGKQIRCPKCKAVAPVPAFEAVEEKPVVEAKVTAPAPAPVPEAKPATGTTVACCIVCNTMIAVLGKVKVVNCPKCGFANPVRNQPGASEEDPEGDRPRKTKRPTADRDDEDEDETPRKKKKRSRDDDDDDEPPRRKKKSRKAKGGSGGIIAVVVICGLLVLAVCGGGLYFLVGKGFSFAKAPPPAGWKQYSYPDAGFKAYFPSEPSVFGANMQPGPGPGAPLPGGIEIPQIESINSYTTGLSGRERVHITVEVLRYRTSLPRSSRDPFARSEGRFAGGEVRQVRWLGGSASEVAAGGALMRVVYLDKVVVVAQITGPNGARATAEEEAGFFDNFELTK